MGLSEKTDFLDVLDQCVADVHAGRKTIEACLEEHPSHRTELAQLLPTAVAIVPLRVTLDPARKLRARFELVEAVHREARGGSGLVGAFAGLRRRLASVAAAALLAVTASGAAVAAAQDAQPSDPLYGLKTAVEQQQVAFAASPEARAHMRVRIADRRLAEAERAIADGREEVAVAAAVAYADAMQRAYDDIEAARRSGSAPAQASEAADDSLARVQDVAAKAHIAGEQAAAAALVEARERAARDRPTTQRVGPARPSAQSTPTPEGRALVAATATNEPTDEADDQERAAPPPPVLRDAPAAAQVRVTQPQPTSPPARGNVTQGNADQRSVPGSEDNRENQQNENSGRGEGNQGAARAVTQTPPTRAAQAAPSVVPTATPPRVVDAPPVDRARDDGDGPGNRDGNGQGRGNDQGRGSPPQAPTAVQRAAPSTDGRPRSTATATATPRSISGDDGRDRATATPTRTGSGDGDRDRGEGDRDRDRGGGDGDGNRGSNRD